MKSGSNTHVAIVDYGMGNLFNVERACRHVGLRCEIVSDPADLFRAAGAIIPGVGAFKDAMDALHSRGLVSALRKYAGSGRPVLGICLGTQLLMNESHEFGRHEGLGLVEGAVHRLESATGDDGTANKVPQVGWNSVVPSPGADWGATCLRGLNPGDFVYFMHSYYVKPLDTDQAIASTRYGPLEFCSVVAAGSVSGVQFHPELSGERGLSVYRAFGESLHKP